MPAACDWQLKQVAHLSSYVQPWITVMIVEKRTLLCEYGKDCASALCGHDARMMFAECVQRLFRTGELTTRSTLLVQMELKA